MRQISIVVPCFNEAPGIRYLSDRLWPAVDRLGGTGDVEVIFVDDGSQDATFDRLRSEFGACDNVRILRHRTNLGIAAAIAAGAAAAEGEVVCTIDSDCTYDPMILPLLIEPIVAGRADVVTASPYHPHGQVVNLPRWRLALSRGASWIYRRLLPVRLHTYTSCCRAYRRSIVPELTFRHPGFLGVTEMLVSAIATGRRVVEVPARLERRRYGASKMKTLGVIRGHLGLVARLLAGRVCGVASPKVAP